MTILFVRILQLILAVVWLAITVMALLDSGTLSFRLPFICTSIGLAVVAFYEFLDHKDRH